jgi:hypothetical protein
LRVGEHYSLQQSIDETNESDDETIVAIEMFVDTDDNTIAVDVDVCIHVASPWMNDNTDNAFFVTILHLFGVFYQYRYIKEQLTTLSATLFDYYTHSERTK